MKKHHATKKTKPRSFDDIVANKDLQLPGLEYFFGRERGMHKLADYARPCFEKLCIVEEGPWKLSTRLSLISRTNIINIIKSKIVEIKYYKENREKCNFNYKMYKLCAKGVVEWQGIVLTPKQSGNKKIYTDEEIKQRKKETITRINIM